VETGNPTMVELNTISSAMELFRVLKGGGEAVLPVHQGHAQGEG